MRRILRSVARGDRSAAGDIDIMVDLDPKIVATMFDCAGVKDKSRGFSTARSTSSTVRR